jgi:threonine dehydrogenase-like Zn-dependent dehydrogenase
MRRLIFVRPGQAEWQEAPEPRINATTQAIIEPLVIARCDLDVAFMQGIIPMKPGTAIGHETVARVREVGDGVTRFAPGDLVAVSSQISCGVCRNCLRGFTGRCESVPLGASFGMGREGDFGCLAADLARIPYADSMLFALPPGAQALDWIGFTDLAVDAWRAVGPQLAERPGANVLVIGGMPQAIGLYAAAIAVALGAGAVDYYDSDPQRLAQASSFGARPIRRGEAEPSHAYEIVVDSHHEAQSMAEAIRWVAPEGFITGVTIHLGAATPVPLMEAYHKGVTLKLGRPNCRTNMDAVCALCLSGQFQPQKLFTRFFDFDEAPQAWSAPELRVVASRLA